MGRLPRDRRARTRRTAVARLPDRMLDREPVRPQRLGDPGRGLVLLERGLGIRMDAM